MRWVKASLITALYLGFAGAAIAHGRSFDAPGPSVEISPGVYVFDVEPGNAGADLGGELRFRGPLALFADANYVKQHLHSLNEVVGQPDGSDRLSLDVMERTQVQGGVRLYVWPGHGPYVQASGVWQGGSYQYDLAGTGVTKDLETAGPAFGARWRWLLMPGSYLRFGADVYFPQVLSQRATDGGTNAAVAVADVNGILATRGPVPLVTLGIGVPL